MQAALRCPLGDSGWAWRQPDVWWLTNRNTRRRASNRAPGGPKDGVETMAVPKRKKSKMRVRQRKAHIKAEVAQASACANCGAPQRAHRVCPSCGFYRGRQVLTVKAAD